MDDKLKIRYVVSTVLVFGIVLFAGLSATALAQEPSVPAKPAIREKSSGRDPFKKFEPVRKSTKGTASKLEPPSIQVRIDRYRAQKLAASLSSFLECSAGSRPVFPPTRRRSRFARLHVP